MQQRLNSFQWGVSSAAFYVDALDDDSDTGQHCNAEKVFSPFQRITKRSKVCTSTIYFVDIFYICRRPQSVND